MNKKNRPSPKIFELKSLRKEKVYFESFEKNTLKRNGDSDSIFILSFIDLNGMT